MASASKSIFEKFLEHLLLVLIALVIILVLVQVFSRYVVQLPFIGIEELARLVFVWACFLGTGLGVIRGRHVSIEFIIRVLPPGMAKFLSIITSVMILITSSIMVTHGSYFVINRWSFPDYSTALLYPRSLFYVPVPLSGAIIFIYTLKQTVSKLVHRS
jgi:TRAP-type C4-dicarboxylate transport system permease small subunit